MEARDIYYKRVLETQLEERCLKNSKYSLRAFATSLNVSPGTLSDIISGKKPLSYKMAERFIERLSLDPENEKRFLGSVVQVQKRRKLARQNPKVRTYDDSKLKLSDLSLENYKYISEWHYITILELTKVKGFKSSPRFIASRLGISLMEAKIAVEGLLELGLLERRNGKLVKVEEHLRLTNMYTGTSAARRKKQKQIRDKAIKAIDEQEVSKRSMTSLTIAIDPDDVPEAKSMIQEFTEEMCRYFEMKKKKEVYALEIGLFSLQEKR